MKGPPTLFLEAIFLLDILKNFFTDYYDEKSHKWIKSFPKIVENYIFTDFIWDLIPMVPVYLFFEKPVSSGILNLYILKFFRFRKAALILDSNNYINFVKTTLKKWTDYKLAREANVLDESSTQDHNNFLLFLVIKYIIKSLSLLILTLNISFFFGILWHKFLDT